MTKEELRIRVDAELLSGLDPKVLAEKYAIPYITVLSWKKHLNSEKTNESISELTHSTEASLEIIKQKARAEAPSVAGKIDNIVDGVIGLKRLEPEFHSSIERAVAVAHEFLKDTDEEGRTTLTIKEWQLITTTLANSYNALFNKTGTTVNVAQTSVNTSSENLAFFKANQKPI